MLSFRAQSGVTLIELVVGLVVAGLLLAVAVPNFRNWMQSAQIRSGAEAIENGLQLALSNAVNSNSPVQFSLTGTDPSWTVACFPASTSCPGVLQTYSAAEGAPNAVVTPTPATVVFNGLGRVTPPATVIFHVKNPNVGGACAQNGGPMRCLDVQVSPGGDIRMCDPALTLTNSADPQAC